MKYISKTQTIALLLFSVLLSVSAQVPPTDVKSRKQFGDQRQLPLYEEPSLIYYEAFTLPAEDSTKSRVDITFRISHGYFIFVRNEKFTAPPESTSFSTNLFPFIAKVEISVELLDHAGISVDREMVRKDVGTNNPERSAHRTEFLQGIFSFLLPPSEYTIVFEVDDLESNRQFLEKSKKVLLGDFTKNPLELSDILLIESLKAPRREAKEFLPVNLGGDVFFGRNFDAYLEIAYNTAPRGSLRLSYSLYKLDESKNDSIFFIRDSLVLNAIDNPKTLDIERTETAYLYRIRESKLPNKLAAFLQLNGEQLTQGHYELRVFVTDGITSQSRVHPFRVRWITMPRSLYNLEFAIDVLEYIATKEEMSDLRAMFAKNRYERLEAFWKKRDPTPGTAFNEAMAEYYRRVDYAMENFNTLKAADGYKTDRGKVYILYGQPTNTERKFSPTAPPKEIWIYEKLKKRFVFIDENRNGNYKLAATENL